MEQDKTVEFEDVACWDLPTSAKKFILQRCTMYTDDVLEESQQVEKLMRTSTPDGIITYLAVHTKTYSTVPDTEKLVYVADTNNESEILGYSEIRLNLTNQSEYFRSKPFEGITQTNPDLWGKGIGTRRMQLLNHASNQIFGLMLNSDTIISNLALPLWERQVALGNAEKYIEGKVVPRYRFLGLTALELAKL